MLIAEAPIHRLTVEDVQRMFEAGILRDERLELVDGVLVDVTHPGPAHSAIVAWLTRHLVHAAGEHEVRVQDVLLVEGGFLSPDLIVVEPLPRDRLPSTAALVVEVSVTTLRYDVRKAFRYSRERVAEYWIVDVQAREVEVHRGPGPEGYADVRRYGDGERVAAEVAPAAPVEVSALLG
jgi:Uma2 family endonuclease